MTFNDNELPPTAREDASAFIVSAGQIRGVHLEAALQRTRNYRPATRNWPRRC
ncbi:MAG: DUF2388 domain-containing protein [Pseudomonas sp.]